MQAIEVIESEDKDEFEKACNTLIAIDYKVLKVNCVWIGTPEYGEGPIYQAVLQLRSTL